MTRGVRIAIIVGGVIVGLIVVAAIVGPALGGGGYSVWWGPGMMGGFGWMWVPMLFFMVVVGLIIWAVVAAVGRSSESKGGDSALDILRQRYARGEISREEYEAKRKDLTQ